MTTCQTCAHARAHSWWGQQATHCRDCHRSWIGATESHCAVCHQHFTSDSVADLHEPFCTADPTTTAESMVLASREDGNPVFASTQRKYGPTWVRWRKRDHYRKAPA